MSGPAEGPLAPDICSHDKAFAQLITTLDEMYFMHLVMNSARGQLRVHGCSLQNMIMHSKHLENFAEDTVTVRGRYSMLYTSWSYSMTITQFM